MPVKGLLQIPKALEIPNILKKAEPIFTETHKLITDYSVYFQNYEAHVIFSIAEFYLASLWTLKEVFEIRFLPSRDSHRDH